MKSFKWVSVLLTILLTISCTKTEDKNVIKIGEYGSLTGPEATFGTSTHNGIMLAMNDVNAQGGINGKQIKVLTVDDQGKAEEWRF